MVAVRHLMITGRRGLRMELALPLSRGEGLEPCPGDTQNVTET